MRVGVVSTYYAPKFLLGDLTQYRQSRRNTWLKKHYTNTTIQYVVKSYSFYSKRRSVHSFSSKRQNIPVCLEVGLVAGNSSSVEVDTGER